MRATTFTYAFLLLGFTALAFAGGAGADGISLLFFAGAVTICACFALKSQRHGFVGASVIALLIVFTVSSRIFALVKPGDGDGAALAANTGSLLVSLGYLVAAYRGWQSYRRRQTLAELESPGETGRPRSAPPGS
jgi:hypothetical protein